MWSRALLLALLALTACGSARVIEVTNVGGTIELSGDRDAALEDASHKMAAHCGPGHYAIVSNTDAPAPTGMRWRVRYECR